MTETIDSTAVSKKKLLGDFGWLMRGAKADIQGGIQIDVNAVIGKEPDGTFTPKIWCNKNCTEKDGGGYTCPGAFTLNKGMIPSSIASLKQILEWIKVGAEGIALFTDEYLASENFDRYCQMFGIPDDVREIIKAALKSGIIQINLFGGNAELHPEILALIRELKATGFNVSFTTTGGRFMNERFAEEFLTNPSDVLALSLDDCSLAKLRRLLEISLPELRDECASYQREHPLHGPGIKAYEAVYAARWLNEVKGSSPLLLFNRVLHPGNISEDREFSALVEQAFQKAIVNRYAGQSAFNGEKSFFNPEQLRLFEEVVDTSIERTLSVGKVVKRGHFWDFMGAILDAHRDNPEAAARAIAGYDSWRCYKRPGSGRYLQIGAEAPRVYTSRNGLVPGGFANCFWNSGTVCSETQVASARQIADYMNGGITRLAAKSKNPCRGCNMPRLQGDGPNLESGMDEIFIPYYLARRKKHIGF
ncbi:MAG: radical SAM protein [bacterium]|nr:radical SAM protein [bacterium]